MENSNEKKIKLLELPLFAQLYYFAIACTFGYLYFQKIISGADFSAANNINSVLSFGANKPFQFRLLIPFLIKLFSIFNFVSQKTLMLVFTVILVYLIIFVYLRILKEYFVSTATCLYVAPFIVYPMFWNYIILNQSFQYYDIAAVFFFVLGTCFVLKDKFFVFTVVFVLGILNKETAVYLILIYVLYNYKTMFTKKILINLFILSFIFLIIKILLSYVFRNNPGDMLEVTYGHNKKILSDIFSNKLYAKNLLFGFGGIYILVAILFLSGKWKQIKSVEYRKKLYMNLAFIPYFVLGIFMVYFTEVRVYAEIIPQFTTLSLVFWAIFNLKGFELINKEN